MANPTRFNTTIQQYSPLISYTGEWLVGLRQNDALFDRYHDGFRVAEVADASLSFSFTGTGVWLYGARRGNHGNFTVDLDGTTRMFDGALNFGYQVILFSAVGLEDKQHTVKLTNVPVEPREYVDLDYITFETVAHAGGTADYIDAGLWEIDSGWSVVNDVDARNADMLVTYQSGAITTLEFEGDTIQVFGTIGPSQGGFLATVDNIESTSSWVNCTNEESGRNSLLYTVTSLTSAKHTLRIEAQDRGSGSTIEIDYAVTRNNKTPLTSTTPSTDSLASATFPTDDGFNIPIDERKSVSVPGIVGGVLGAIALLLLISAFLLWKLRLRRKVGLILTTPIAQPELADAPYRDVEEKRVSKWQMQMHQALQDSSAPRRATTQSPNPQALALSPSLQAASVPRSSSKRHRSDRNTNNSRSPLPTSYPSSSSPMTPDSFPSPNSNTQLLLHEPLSSQPPPSLTHDILASNLSLRLPPPNYWQAIGESSNEEFGQRQ